MDKRHGTRPLLGIAMLLAIVLDTAGQLLWKHTAAILPDTGSYWSMMDAVIRQPLVLVLVGIFVCQLINWMKVLEHADLSYAQPITSLSYISVCVLSAYLFGEHVGSAKLAGILCILAGVWLVSQSKPLAEPIHKQ